MPRYVPIRPSADPLAKDPRPNHAPVLDVAAEHCGADQAQRQEDLTLHARVLWGRLIVKVARVEAKENPQ
jgi:hypothetical protein